MAVPLAAAAWLVAAGAGLAAGPGGRIFATGGPVQIQVLPAGAAFTSQIWLDSPGAPQYLGVTSQQTGAIAPVGSFSAGQELVFAILVQETGDYFRMGPASNNPDNVIHAVTTDVGPGLIDVGFEDLFGGGDNDFDDAVFQV